MTGVFARARKRLFCPGLPGLRLTLKACLPSLPAQDGLPSLPAQDGLPSLPAQDGLPSLPAQDGLPSRFSHSLP